MMIKDPHLIPLWNKDPKRRTALVGRGPHALFNSDDLHGLRIHVGNWVKRNRKQLAIAPHSVMNRQINPDQRLRCSPAISARLMSAYATKENRPNAYMTTSQTGNSLQTE